MPRTSANQARSWVPRWLSHRALLLAEAILVVALLQMLAKDWVFAQSVIPGPVRTLIGMALIVGAFGWALVWLRDSIKSGLQTTHKAARKLPLAKILLHMLAFAALFAAYTWYWQLPVTE